jgi:hydroxylysine kinase
MGTYCTFDVDTLSNVYGIPGFESGDDAEDFDFAQMSEDEAIAVSDAWYGVTAGSAVRLDTERDDSFRLQTSHGERVLKVAHPADSEEVIDFQVRALQHAARADGSLPLQRVVPTLSGQLWVSLPSGRVARMLEWLPGELLLNVTTGPNELAALGDALGRLSKSLSSFDERGGAILSAWDLQTIPRLATLLDVVPHDSVAEAISRFNSRVAPRLAELPMQIIHNDFNPGNVLVDPSAPQFVVGILDFGDVMHSLRVADLAIAISYALHPMHHDWQDITPLISGFDDHVPLTDLERALLPDLVAARFAQRILINSWVAQRENETYDAHDSVVATLSALLNLEA